MGQGPIHFQTSFVICFDIKPIAAKIITWETHTYFLIASLRAAVNLSHPLQPMQSGETLETTATLGDTQVH